MNNVQETMVAIHKLQQQIDSGIGDVDRDRALETMTNLASNVFPDQLAKLLLIHYRMGIRLRRILQTWHINKKVILQSIEEAKNYGDLDEMGRLKGRLDGVEVIYDALKDAVNLNQIIDGKRWKPEKGRTKT